MIPQIITSGGAPKSYRPPERMVDQAVAIFECPELERGELLVYHSMRVVVQVGFVGLAAAIIIALHAIEAQTERGGDDLSKVKLTLQESLIGAAMRIVLYASFVHKDG